MSLPPTHNPALTERFAARIRARLPRLKAADAEALAHDLIAALSDRAEEYHDAQETGTDPLARELIQQMRDQLLLALIRRAGGEITVPVKEIDAAGGLFLTMRTVDQAFVFGADKKN